jgi:hypothetical protein
MRTILVVLFALGVILIGCSDDDDGAESDDQANAAAVIEAYEAAYNSGDIDAIVAVFSEDAVITDHAMFRGELTGPAEIQSLHLDDMSRAAEGDAYSISNVEADGDTVTWDHVWTDNRGEEWCLEGQSAVVTEGKIVTWTWPTKPHRCE